MAQSQTMYALLITAASVGVIHTLIGPDHYLPFVALAKTKKWSLPHTLWITFLCGLGHVLSSVIIGSIGIFLGSSLNALESIESSRADIVKWLFLAFAVTYMVYGLKKALTNGIHIHLDGTIHTHNDCQHLHSNSENQSAKVNFWVLFIIFTFGPCEALIPMLMYPAQQHNLFGIVAITTLFSVSTIATMLVAVALLMKGIDFINLDFEKFQRWNHFITGFILALCALFMFVGL